MIEHWKNSMSATWLYALVPNATPPLHSVFLTFDSEDADASVTRYLVTEFEGQVLPIGVDYFDSVAEAKNRCQEDLGITVSDWQEVADEPAFHAPAVEAREEVIENYLADAEWRAIQDYDTLPDATPDDL